MPAMAAAIVLFIFLTGFMLSEIRNLHSENGELRDEVAFMETALAGRVGSGAGTPGGRSIFRRDEDAGVGASSQMGSKDVEKHENA